jgi:hypothetical protein
MQKQRFWEYNPQEDHLASFIPYSVLKNVSSTAWITKQLILLSRVLLQHFNVLGISIKYPALQAFRYGFFLGIFLP